MGEIGLLIRSTFAFALCIILIFQIFSIIQFGITDSKNAFAQTSGSSPTSYTTYQNNNEGVSIEYPSDWKYSEKTQGQAMLTYFTPPNNSHTFLELSYDKTTDYTGTDQQILGELPQIIGILCSNASIAKNGFTCSNFQYTTAIGKYHGAPSYVMHGKMTETLSDGTTREQDTVQFLIITQNSDYGIFATCTKDECGNYNDELTHIVNSLNIYSLKTTNDSNAATQVSSYNIPSWIKNTAKWWSQGAVTDDDFVKGVQYLIQQGVITVPTTQVSSQSSHAIPSWVKNNAKWWSEGQVGDSDFVKGIQYLVQNGIIVTQTSTTATLMVTYTDKDGVSLSVLAVPGEVLLFASPNSNPNDVSQMISSNGGSILSQDLKMGFYLVKVDNVKNFISSSYKYSFVIDSFPNEILSEYTPTSTSPTGYIDLTKTNRNDVTIPTNTKVLVVQIDNFVYGTGDATCPYPHGVCVSKQNDLLSGNGDVAILHLQDKHGPDSKVSVADVINNMRDAISIAEKYKAKLVINLSLGVATSDEHNKLYQDAEQRVKDDTTHELETVMNTKWFKDGNVIISKAAPNDSIDLSKINNELRSSDVYGKAFNSYIITSQTKDDENGNQKLTAFVGGATSAYGNGVVFVKRENNCGGGASCAVYGTTATQALLWSSYPGMTSNQMVELIKSNTNIPQGGKYPVVDQKGAFLAAWQKYSCVSSCTNYGQSDNKLNHLVQSQSTNTQTTNANQPAAKYKTPEDYCQGTYGSKYHYDSSTNKCTSYGGYGSKESYCQGTYGSDYHYDSSQNLCVQSPGGTSSGNSGGQTTTITPARDLSGTWSGSFSMKDTTSDGCSFSGTWEATLTQNGNDLSGSISIIDASSPDYPVNDFCTLAPGTFSFSGGTVSSSSFQFDSSDLGGFQAKGYFTTDLIHGTFNECSDQSCASGSFTGSRG